MYDLDLFQLFVHQAVMAVQNAIFFEATEERPDRYAFRAGRNLPDKEFRYLRTVIVTAAVYWGLSSELRLR